MYHNRKAKLNNSSTTARNVSSNVPHPKPCDIPSLKKQTTGLHDVSYTPTNTLWSNLSNEKDSTNQTAPASISTNLKNSTCDVFSKNTLDPKSKILSTASTWIDEEDDMDFSKVPVFHTGMDGVEVVPLVVEQKVVSPDVHAVDNLKPSLKTPHVILEKKTPAPYSVPAKNTLHKTIYNPTNVQLKSSSKPQSKFESLNYKKPMRDMNKPDENAGWRRSDKESSFPLPSKSSPWAIPVETEKISIRDHLKNSQLASDIAIAQTHTESFAVNMEKNASSLTLRDFDSVMGSIQQLIVVPDDVSAVDMQVKGSIESFDTVVSDSKSTHAENGPQKPQTTHSFKSKHTSTFVESDTKKVPIFPIPVSKKNNNAESSKKLPIDFTLPPSKPKKSINYTTPRISKLDSFAYASHKEINIEKNIVSVNTNEIVEVHAKVEIAKNIQIDRPVDLAPSVPIKVTPSPATVKARLPIMKPIIKVTPQPVVPPAKVTLSKADKESNWRRSDPVPEIPVVVDVKPESIVKKGKIVNSGNYKHSPKKEEVSKIWSGETKATQEIDISKEILPSESKIDKDPLYAQATEEKIQESEWTQVTSKKSKASIDSRNENPVKKTLIYSTNDSETSVNSNSANRFMKGSLSNHKKSFDLPSGPPQKQKHKKRDFLNDTWKISPASIQKEAEFDLLKKNTGR